MNRLILLVILIFTGVTSAQRQTVLEAGGGFMKLDGDIDAEF